MNQIGLTWEQGTNSGGSEVIDYRILYKIESGDYSLLTTGLTVQYYTAQNLAAGTTYTFKVQSRNIESYSDFSEEVSILAAQPPTTPDAPTTTWYNDQVLITWDESAANGAAITSYTITI